MTKGSAIIGLAVCGTVGLAGLAAGQAVVVPNALAAVEGGGANSFPLSNISQNHRYQQVYRASDFAVLAGPHRILEVRFRPNGTSTFPAWSATAQLEVLFSTVLRGPDELSPVYSENPGSNEMLVLSGLVTYGTQQAGTNSGGPMDFDVVLELQAPFEYDPAAGNLLLEIRRTSTTIGTNRFLDSHSVVGDSISRVYSSTAGAQVGTTDSNGLVTMFVVQPILGVCYANCDGSTTEPVLNVADFSCFLGKFAAGDPYANCDGSTTEPVLNVADFSCFLAKFAAGCR
jgi:hypothetical protein